MKLKNRVMSWILSPGAYAVWMALGVREDWVLRGEFCIKHDPTSVELWMGNGSFFFDQYDGDSQSAIGLLERLYLQFADWR